MKWKFGGKNADADNSFEKCILLAVDKGIIKRETVFRIAEELKREKK